MRHVTDGELHAFLDGGLDLLPDDRGNEVRDHISACPVCQERLQDEEHIRSEAKGILRDPPFDQVILPSFEELRERAGAPGVDGSSAQDDVDEGSHYRGPLRGVPLAWAATIVLALGVGWMGGQVWPTSPLGPQFEPRESSHELVEQSGAQMVDLDPGSGETEDPQPSRAELAARDLQRRQAVAEPEASPVGLEAVPPGSELAPSEILERRGADSAAPESVGSTLSSKWVGASRTPTPAMAFSAAGIEGTSDSVATSFGMVERSDSLENSLAVPGLKVVSIEWEERVAGEKTLLIRQLLPPGDTLELRYFGMLLGADPKLEEAASGRVFANVMEASLPSGWNQVVMEWGRGLLVARAPIPEENLKALLKYLR